LLERPYSEDALIWEQWIEDRYWADHGIERPERPSHLASRLRRLGKQSLRPPQARWRTLRDALTACPPLQEPDPKPSPAVFNHVFIPGARLYPGHTGSTLDRPAKAIKAGYHGNPGGEHILVRSPDEYRYLSVRECARVQTFPDDYELTGSRSECMRQLGNAVPVSLAQLLANQIYDRLGGVLERDDNRVLRNGYDPASFSGRCDDEPNHGVDSKPRGNGRVSNSPSLVG
jgi:DNA (cytosine-5)-methyltransferase 1